MYRFIDNEGSIVYVGRTINLGQRFLNHDHLTKDIKKIEYIECKSEADMAWKEVYYINLFRNKKTTNSASVFSGDVTLLPLNDEWIDYKWRNEKYMIDLEHLLPKDIINQIDVTKIHIFRNDKINSIGDDDFALSAKWFRNATDKQIKLLSNNNTNYFKNICKTKSHESLWTTFDEYKNKVSGKGFRKGFISLNDTNVLHHTRRYLSFLCNIFSAFILKV